MVAVVVVIFRLSVDHESMVFRSSQRCRSRFAGNGDFRRRKLDTTVASACKRHGGLNAKRRRRSGNSRVGRADVLMWRPPTSTLRVQHELLARPGVHVVVEGGGSARRVQLGHSGSAGDRRVLVTNVTNHVTAEVGTVRTRRTAETLQLQLLHTKDLYCSDLQHYSF